MENHHITRESTKSTILQAGPLKMDLKRHQVTWHQEPVCLTPMEYIFLQVLLSHQGHCLTYQQLWQLCRGCEEEKWAATEFAKNLVCRLRRKINFRQSVSLDNLTRVGYRLMLKHEQSS